jgi:hypothetical protein
VRNLGFNKDFGCQLLVKISALDDDAKTSMLLDYVEALRPLTQKNRPSANPKLIETQPKAALAEVLKNHYQGKYADPTEARVAFLNSLLDYFLFDYKFDRNAEKFGVRISRKNQEYFLIYHTDNYFSDDIASAILFLLTELYDNMVDEYLSAGITRKQFMQDIEKNSVPFPLLVMHPSIKFDRIRTQEGSFLFQVPFNLANKDNRYVGFSKIEADIKILVHNRREIYESLDKIGVNRRSLFPDHDNTAAYLKEKFLFECPLI